MTWVKEEKHVADWHERLKLRCVKCGVIKTSFVKASYDDDDCEHEFEKVNDTPEGTPPSYYD